MLHLKRKFLLHRLLEGENGDGKGAGGGAAGAGAGGTDGATGKAGAGGDGSAGAGNGDGSAGSGGAGSGAGKSSGEGASKEGAADGPLGFPTDWRERVAGEDKKLKGRLDRYSDPKALTNALVSLQDRISAGELRSKLKPDATADEVKAWRAENGVPEAPDKYDIKLAKGDITDADREIMKDFLTAAHGKNFTNEQVSTSIEAYNGIMAKHMENLAAKDAGFKQETEDALRVDWGNAEYRPNINAVTNLLATMPESVRDKFSTGRMSDGRPILNHPDTQKWLLGLAKQINPQGGFTPQNTGAGMAGSIEAEIKDIEKVMRTDRPAYDKDEKMRDRYKDLLEARDRAR